MKGGAEYVRKTTKECDEIKLKTGECPKIGRGYYGRVLQYFDCESMVIKEIRLKYERYIDEMTGLR